MKFFFFSTLIFVISACSNIPAPSLISPDENTLLQNVNYGSSPDNYQKILKDYLIKNLKNYKTAKVEFINEPSKLSIDHLGDNYSGFRVCLSINEQRGDYYIGYRNHFFMINNNSISLHLYDSGLLTIPFEYCVTRDTTKEIFIDDIPDRKKEITVDKMDDIILSKKPDEIETIGNTYILCIFDNKEITYVFNESKKSFKRVNKLEEEDFVVNFNEAFIVATLPDLELSINRVSGNASMLNESKKNGNCTLTDKTKF